MIEAMALLLSAVQPGDVPADVAPRPLVIWAQPPAVPPPLLAPVRPPDAPPEVPRAVLAVIDAAIASGDPAAVAAVIKYTAATNPDTRDRIEAIHQDYLARLAAREARQAEEKRAAMLAAGPFDYWKGSVELGASRATGNARTLALYAAVALERPGVFWTQKLTARIDYQRTNGATTTDRVLAAWQPRRNFDDRLYAYGLGQYERDRFVGFADRYTAGAGVGYSVLKSDRLRLDLEGGPALRRTDFTTEPTATNLAARASLGFKWTVNSSLNITQDAALYLERGSTNATATTALDTRLFGPLKARLSYNLLYEPDATVRAEALDTVTRATLVFSF